MINVTQCRARLDPGGAPYGVNVDPLHPREVDDEPAVAQGGARHVVASAFDRHPHVVLSGETHGRHNVRDARTLGDQSGTLINHPVPDSSRRVVTLVVLP